MTPADRVLHALRWLHAERKIASPWLAGQALIEPAAPGDPSSPTVTLRGRIREVEREDSGILIVLIDWEYPGIRPGCFTLPRVPQALRPDLRDRAAAGLLLSQLRDALDDPKVSVGWVQVDGRWAVKDRWGAVLGESFESEPLAVADALVQLAPPPPSSA
jgi:hypothetical protein